MIDRGIEPEPVAIRIEPWAGGDLPILHKTLGDPEMTKHIGGPESEEKMADRQVKFERLADSGTGRMFKIVDEATGEGIGSVGYWERDWRGDEVYEIGWFVVTEFQGRGIGSRATELAVASARAERKHRFLHAFPAVANLPSNAIPRKLGFTLLEELEFEYPAGSGNFLRCNDWRLDLFGAAPTP